jgi:hypothetical protein
MARPRKRRRSDEWAGRAGLPAKDSVTEIVAKVAPTGMRFRILKTTERDSYDHPSPSTRSEADAPKLAAAGAVPMKRPPPRIRKKTSKGVDVPAPEPTFKHGRAFERLRDFDTARGLAPTALPADATVSPRGRPAKRSAKRPAKNKK